jgi:uncharacterized membrane protein YphA (DoxX/SURF4 family)
MNGSLGAAETNRRKTEGQKLGGRNMAGSACFWRDAASVVVRWLLGVLFVYMGLNKALHPTHFQELILQYNMVSNPVLLNCIAAALPWLEAYCGLLLIAGIAVRGTALLLLLMLAAFTPLIWHRALELAALQQLAFCAIRFDCGCGMGEVYACNKLVENSLLFLLSAWLAVSRRSYLCLRFSLWKQ